jgi:hypothetical protein
MNALASRDSHEIMERVLSVGDLSQLTTGERNDLYGRTCLSLGLNPLTRPFEYIRLQGKLVLYAKRDAADQLRKLHNISLRILEQRTADGLFLVTVEAQDKTGRVDSDVGAVALDNLRGEARANAILKAITKAKRRVTLSICGLGMLDETEVSDVPVGERQSWEEPKAEAKPEEPEQNMRQMITIKDAAGATVCVTSIWQEALKRYGEAKRDWGVDASAVARANLDALKAILPFARNGTHDRLKVEIEAIEATMEAIDQPREVDADGVVIEGESQEPAPAPPAEARMTAPEVA